MNFLIKPASYHCNLACDYCFYKRVEGVYPHQAARMSLETAEDFMREALALGQVHNLFCWQGGEPTLLGLDFYRNVIDLQRKYVRPGQIIENSIQTNGILLNREWTGFLKQHRILVGLSLDGPREIHDKYRRAPGGQGTYDDVMKAARLLELEGAEFNILTLLTSESVDQPEALYRFFREQGFTHLQFIPCLEFDPETGSPEPYSITGRELGDFYIRLFDLWLEDGFPNVSIRLFEDLLIWLLDGVKTSCGWMDKCDSYLLVEHNGDCYPCDFFVYPEWRLGNLRESGLGPVLSSPVRRRFAGQKSNIDPACGECRYMAFCRGDCTRFRGPGPRPGQNRSLLCEAWQGILAHIESHPKDVRVMALQARDDFQKKAAATGRNEPCPCGSGKKFKKCCGR